jgi:hypothetical protein
MVHLNIKERLANGELMHNKFGKLVSTKKHKLGLKLYKKYEDVMVANRKSPFGSSKSRKSSRSQSMGGSRRRYRGVR